MAKNFIRATKTWFDLCKRYPQEVAQRALTVLKQNPSLVEESRDVGKAAAKVAKKVELGKKTGYKFNYRLDVDLRGTEKTYKHALKLAFDKTGIPKSAFKVTKWAKDARGKSHPVEWRSKEGAEVNIDLGHTKNGPDFPHIGYQTAGKRGLGGAKRRHIIVDSVPINR